MNTLMKSAACFAAAMVISSSAFAQMGKRYPSEKKEMVDPVTGAKLTFLTTAPSGDNTLYQTHQGWTADGKWIVFRSSDRVPDQGSQVYAVNEESGVIVQLTEGQVRSGSGDINVAQKSMKMYYTRNVPAPAGRGPATTPSASADPITPIMAQTQGVPATQPTTQPGGRRGRGGGGATQPGARGGGGAGGTLGVYELDLAKLFADSAAGTMKPRESYERLCGTLPPGMGAGGGFGLDADEQIAYISVRGGDVGQKLAPGSKVEGVFGPRNMGAGPSGIRKMDLKTGQTSFVVDVGVQIGHLQANPFNPGEIIYCWETGGKAPVRAWVVNADGTNNRPVFNEAEFDWVTHETVATKDEVIIGILGHRRIGSTSATSDWGTAGTKAHPTGIAVSNIRTGGIEIVGQVPDDSVWHVNGSYDGRWVVADDFQRRIWVWDRKSGERNLISTGHRTTAADHPHPIFNPAGTRILVQSAMIAADQRAHDLCVIHMPKAWLNRTYSDKAPE